MARKKYTPEQIIGMLRKAEIGLKRSSRRTCSSLSSILRPPTWVSNRSRRSCLVSSLWRLQTPRTPPDNAYIETFNGSLRDECLNLHWFDTIAEARQLIEAWRIDYNVSRPHMALGNLIPAEYAAGITTSMPSIGGIAVGN